MNNQTTLKDTMAKNTYPRLEIRDLPTLKSHPDAVRSHSPTDAFLLSEQVKVFGVLRPPVVNDRTGTVLDGDLLLRALAMLEMRSCPCWVVDVPEELEDVAHLSLNNHYGEWDWQAVSGQLKQLQEQGKPVKLTGFHEYDTGPLIAADWTPAAKGPLDGSDPNQTELL